MLLASHLEIEPSNPRCIMTPCLYETFGRYGSSSPCPPIPLRNDFTSLSVMYNSPQEYHLRTGHLPNCGLMRILIRQSPKWILTSLTFVSQVVCALPVRSWRCLLLSVHLGGFHRLDFRVFWWDIKQFVVCGWAMISQGNPQGLHVRRGFVEIWKYRFPDRSMQ